MKKMVAALVLGAVVLSGTMVHGKEPLMQDLTMKEASIAEMKVDTRTFPVDSSILAKKVQFENRYGFTGGGYVFAEGV